jgi:RND family efflux transporter MFP subunit
MSRTRQAAVVVLLATTACRGTKPPASAITTSNEVLVRAVPVVLNSSATERATATGTLAAKEEMRLSFKTGGVIGKLLVREGEEVKAGQPLALLDLAEIDAQVAKAQSAADQADRDLARIRNLYKDSVATLSQLEAATTGASLAKADLQTAQFNRKYATVVAPTAGTILRRLHEANEIVAPGIPVLVMKSNESGMVLRAGLADRDAVRIRVGDPATVKFAAYPGTAFSGHVSEIAPAASAGSGAYDVEVRLDSGRNLSTGLIGTVDIIPSRTESLRVVPIEAVIEGDGDHATVFALGTDGKTVRRTAVTVAFIRDGHVAIRSGLEGVTSVITDGAAYLTDGAAVKVAAAAPRTN